MGIISVALLIVALWICILLFMLAIAKASGRADADEERYLAEARDYMSNQSLAPHSDATIGDEGKSTDRAELQRAAERLGIELPERPPLHPTPLVGTRRCPS
jgi:hypothetical protein